MADIRINALATTAASTASDDFVAVDGSANGTRKLNAYSPTFGGNLSSGARITANNGFTATATVPTVVAASTNLDYNSVGAKGRLFVWGPDAGTVAGFELNLANSTNSSLINALSFNSTGNATLAGNLTVSGTGTSSIGGNTKIGNPANANQRLVVDGAVAGVGVITTNTGLSGGYLYSDGGTGGVVAAWNGGNYSALSILGSTVTIGTGASGTTAATITSGGNVLIGTTTDGGQKLQVSGTANFSSGSSANTLSLISTDSTAYSATGYNSAYRVWLYGNGATSAYNFIRFSGGGSNEAAFGTVQNASGRAEFVWQTYDGSAYGERLRIASGGDATFAGAVTAGGNVNLAVGKLLTLNGNATAGSYALQAATAGAPYDFRIIGASDSGTQRYFSFGYYTGDNIANAWNEKARINSYTGDATFVGSIAIGNTVQTAASVASTHKVTIYIGGTAYYLLATNV